MSAEKEELPGRLNFIRRWCGTALSFFLFGVGGLLQSLLLHPLVYLLVWNEARRRKISRRIAGSSMQLFLRIMSFTGVLYFYYRGTENIDPNKNYLIVSNHPSLIDIILLLSLFPEANCVVKASMANNPLFYFLIKSAGYLSNEDPIDMLLQAVEVLEKGESFIIFPEGTRTQHSSAPVFDKGAAAIALKARVEFLPIAIECTPTTLTRQDVWYRIPEKKVRLGALIGGPVSPSEWCSDAQSLRDSSEVVTQRLERHIQQQMTELSHSPAPISAG